MRSVVPCNKHLVGKAVKFYALCERMKDIIIYVCVFFTHKEEQLDEDFNFLLQGRSMKYLVSCVFIDKTRSSLSLQY